MATRKSTSPPPPELPWSWHTSLGWRGQLKRIRRWQLRLRAAHDIRDAEDYMYAFFQLCYHLRDWLLSEKVLSESEVEQLFKRNVELRLCGDLANAIKHRKLNRPKQPREPSLAREYCGAGGGWFGPARSETFTVLSDGRSFEVRSLADKCLAVWEGALRKHGLDTACPEIS